VTDALSRLLAALVEGGKRADSGKVEVKERMVLEKFDGDVTGLSKEEKEARLEEVIVVEEDGSVDVWHKGEDRARPT
jgi:hypothetical protein